ncbi:hypothetical protein ABZW44_22555 [Streptomyces mirabilis]|uniref:hypothetical protein n=1 Tax=Streptomyces mirabilis TaxID=68239 RepID=UPI0033B14C1A
MQKATLTEASIAIASGIVAASLGSELAGHHVSPAAIVTTLLAVISTGLYVAQQIGQGFRTSLCTCPVKGCPTSIRAKGTSPEELDRLRVFAADHSKHGGPR